MIADYDTREADLPEWAKDTIAALRTEITVAMRMIAQFNKASEETVYQTITSPTILRFGTPGGEVTVSYGMQGVYLNSASGIVVRAMSSNGICVTGGEA